MAPAKSMERASSFAMACSLLSRYVRENGATAGELGLGIKAEAADAQRTSVDAEKGEAKKATMDLFPQNAGFGPEAAAQGAPDAREKEKRQLTIFYAGKVLVFNDFPAEKAKDLMQMAGKGASVAQNSGVLPAPSVATVTDSTKVAVVPAAPIPVVSAQKNAADIPQAPKASLRRFLEKRKDRITAKAPYQTSPSDATPVKKEMPENQPWLGLGPQTANPDLSLGKERNQ
ncbi:Protein TIFY 10a [Dichanthelium oligosanthes]|uniref:Protein TIFY n=1 Tax=Dichanthelium oligosanthes TaxID=888268 RepID=A0A1E5WKU6_9POAL|nr:Protein TIFY 10a [Dichanthelium oligosanthes]